MQRMIPHAIVPERFIYREKKQDFVLFLGRLTHGKGLHIAIEACRLAFGNASQQSTVPGRSVPAAPSSLAGPRLVVAGTHHGPESDELLDLGRKTLGSAFEYVGFADYWKRRELLADAKALIYPTPALEPFGYTVLEANVSGTPALVSDWGAFAETVENGVNGFRCRGLMALAEATARLGEAKPALCRESVLERFGAEALERCIYRFLAPAGGGCSAGPNTRPPSAAPARPISQTA